MSKLLVALIAASFATVAGAQAGATKQEKQGTVQSVTQDAAKSTTAQGEAADVAKAKQMKSDPKALPDKSAKQAATAQTTKAQAEGGATAQSQAADVAKAKSEKGTPKAAKPDLKDPAVQKQMQKAATQ
jgi:hypothetical protein